MSSNWSADGELHRDGPWSGEKGKQLIWSYFESFFLPGWDRTGWELKVVTVSYF